MSVAGLGISMACHRGHLPFLPACLTSIRKWIPEIPITIFLDGIEIDKNILKKFHLEPFPRKKVKSKWLREHSFGFGLTKMIGFWEAPFERVFHLDVDTIMWGDVRKNFPKITWDVLHNEPHEIITPKIQKEQYFCTKTLEKELPDFLLKNKPFFNSGVICIKKNVLNLDFYIKLLELQKKNQGKIGPGEQGILNLLVFKGEDMGELKTASTHLQTVVPVCEREILLKKFQSQNIPTVFHWAGKKPWVLNPGHFPEPMHLFRRKSAVRPRSKILDLDLVLEEIKHFWLPENLQKVKNRSRNLLMRILFKNKKH
ncbi:MAG: glycosyltransferase [Verrucomicrobia bacterium]|nr:glycosyltransferase [Verrucomicrobiota bacterium]